MRRTSFFALCFLASPGLAAALASSACSNDGALRSPVSDNQSDDPCDPGGGSTNTGPAAAVDAGTTPVALPGGADGIGFDDMRFSPTLAMLLVPGGRSGNLDFVDPSSEVVTPVSGFSIGTTYTTGDDSFGVTSADEGNAVVYATDRTSQMLAVVDPKGKTILSQTKLAAVPGYVRYVTSTNELWVTEPAAQQIEVFTLGTSTSTPPAHAATISVAGGPESLEIDVPPSAKGGKAYAFTHTATATVEIDVAGRSVAATWSNGCATSKGLAVDSLNGWLITACQEGMLVIQAAVGGATLGTAMVGAGVDQIAYDPQTQRVYVPGPSASAMSVVSLGTGGVPTVLGSVQTPNDTHCAVTNGGGSVYVCAPSTGALLFIQDPF